jgi:hypothetical protein
MIEKTLLVDRNFLLDTGGMPFLTFHNSRKVRRIYKGSFGVKGAQGPGSPSMTCEVFCGDAVIPFDRPFRIVRISSSSRWASVFAM